MISSNELPTSPALAEAGSGTDNLAELLSRDPEGYSEADLDTIIASLREQRLRWEAADAAGAGGRSKAAKPPPAKVSLSALGLLPSR